MTDFKIDAPLPQFENPVAPNEHGYLMETPTIPEIRLEWHPKRQTLYYVPKWVKPERAVPITTDILNPKMAEAAATIFCQGYTVAKQQTRRLLV